MTEKEAKRRIVALARGQVGYHEGANNWNKYAEDPRITALYGWNVQGQPWCCTFVNWLFLQLFDDVGARMTYGGTAACNASANLYKNHAAWRSTPEVGDQIFFYSGGGINHTGIVIEVEGSAIKTVEGNYSDGVGIGSYVTGSPKIAGYGRPNWSLAADVAEVVIGDPVSEPDTDPQVKEVKVMLPELARGCTGAAVERLQTLLIGRGYFCGGRVYSGREHPDGDFGPATEVAVRDLQLSAKIKQTGRVDSSTWTALIKN